MKPQRNLSGVYVRTKKTFNRGYESFFADTSVHAHRILPDITGNNLTIKDNVLNSNILNSDHITGNDRI